MFSLPILKMLKPTSKSIVERWGLFVVLESTLGSSSAPELHLGFPALKRTYLLGEFSVFQTCEYSSPLAHPERCGCQD